MNNRAKVQAPDVVAAAAVMVTIAATADIWVSFGNDLKQDTGPLTDVFIDLVLPALLISIVLSVGITAIRRRGPQA